jgi:hypothetical protein
MDCLRRFLLILILLYAVVPVTSAGAQQEPSPPGAGDNADAGETSSVALVDTASSRDIFGCSKNRQNRIVENSTYPLDDFGFR